jgi:glycosyltransferase involved in cell wall biosynthesis
MNLAEGQPGPLRVALDATPLLGQPTGVGVFCLGALTALGERADLDVQAFAVSWRLRQGIEARLPPGVVVRQRAMPARPLRAAWLRAELPPIEWFVGPVQVVHGTNFVVPPTHRAARVVTVHDLTMVRFPQLSNAGTLVYPELIRRAVAHGAWVHAVSAYVAAEVVETFGVDPARVRAVHSGVPPMAVPDRSVVARLHPPVGGRIVLAIGTVEPRKDLPGLVRAFEQVAGDRPDVSLVLAGPEGWGTDQLADAIAASPFAGRIVRTGWLDDASLAGLLQAATVLAYPSVYEGFGFPPLQAMAAGVPVVATRAGALPEVLGEAAAFVDVGDIDRLAETLAEVLDSDERRAALVAAGRDRVAGYTWDACAAGLAALYRDAAAEAPRRRSTT